MSRRNSTEGHNKCPTHVKRGVLRGANIIGRTVRASVYVQYFEDDLVWFYTYSF